MEFTVKTIINAEPSAIYHAWLNSKQHSKMTGSKAKVSDHIGETYSAWDGYISGMNLVLVENKQIIQTWRTTEFDTFDENSQLEIDFKPVPEGTEITLVHTNLPYPNDQYKRGWEDHYFAPMKQYFEHVND